MAKVKTRIRFTVEGSGDFPFDMLRRDCCWPEREADSGALDLIRNAEYFTPRRVTLLSDNYRVPTDGCWKSFAWKVIGVETFKITS